MKMKSDMAESSVKTNILIAFFLVLALIGTIMNTLFINTVTSTLASSGLDSELIKTVTRHYTIIGSGVTIGSMIFVLFFALMLTNNITRPMKVLIDGMEKIATGRFNTRIDVVSNDEFGRLTEGFNTMACHIEDAMNMLQSSKRYTDNIVLSVPSMLIVLNENMQILSSNAAFSDLCSKYPMMRQEQFIGSLQDEIRAYLRNDKSINTEFTYRPEGSNTDRIFSAVISGIDISGTGPEMQLGRILLTITDRTESIRIKELLKQSKQDWEDTFDTIPDMITIHDKNYNIIMANQAARELLKIDESGLPGSCKCYKKYHGTEAAPRGCPSCNCLKTEAPATFELFEPHLNKHIEIRSIPRFNKQGEMVGLIHITRDISLRREIEDEHSKLLIGITKAKMEWEMTFDSVNEHIVLIDNELKISRCNKSFCNFVGVPVDDITGRSCHEFFSCPPERVEECRKRISRSEELQGKMEIRTESGRWLYVSHRPIRDERGSHIRTVITSTDVTEMKNAQDQIKDSENELQHKVQDLEKFYDMAVGREVRMKELKKEIKLLNSKLEGYEKEFSVN